MNELHVHLWKGRPVTELDREELLEAFDFVATELHRLQSPDAIRHRAMGRAREFTQKFGL